MNVLFVSLRPYYDVLERSLIRDAQSLSSDHNLFFYCAKESFLDEQLRQNFSQISYYSGSWASGRKKFDLRKLLVNNSIDLVHCYDLSSLASITYSLNTNIKISLVLTIGKRMHDSYQGIFFRRMIKRVDRIFLTTSLLEFSVANQLGVQRHKICDLGIGETYSCSLWMPTRTTFLKKYGIFEDLFTIGIYIPTEFKYVEDFYSLIPYIRHIQMRLGSKVKFFLYSPLDWNKGPLYKELSIYFEEQQISEMVSFSHSSSFLEVSPNIDLWISAFHETNLVDYYIQALSLGTPVVWVRDYCSETIMERYPKMGETFKKDDARELGEHIVHFMSGNHCSDSEYIATAHRLLAEDNAARHKEVLEENYKRLFERRLRHANRKVKKLFWLRW